MQNPAVIAMTKRLQSICPAGEGAERNHGVRAMIVRGVTPHGISGASIDRWRKGVHMMRPIYLAIMDKVLTEVEAALDSGKPDDS